MAGPALTGGGGEIYELFSGHGVQPGVYAAVVLKVGDASTEDDAD
jgi:hypothetical protein